MNRILIRVAKDEDDQLLRIMYPLTKQFIRNNIYTIFPEIKKKYIERSRIQNKIYSALSSNKEYMDFLREHSGKNRNELYTLIKYFLAYHILEIQEYCNKITERNNIEYKVEPKKSLKDRLFSLDIFKSLLNNEQYDKLLPYIFPKMREYIDQNFREICKTLDLKKYDPKQGDPASFIASWNDDPKNGITK